MFRIQYTSSNIIVTNCVYQTEKNHSMSGLYSNIQCVPPETLLLNCELEVLKIRQIPHRYIIFREKNGYL